MEANHLIAEVARTTGVRLDKSDPILAAAVVHEALLNEALVKLDRQVKIQADRVTTASTQAVVDAKREAEALLTEAGEWVEARIKAAGESAAATMLAELQGETRKFEQARRTTLMVAWALAAAGLILISGAAGVILASFR